MQVAKQILKLLLILMCSKAIYICIVTGVLTAQVWAQECNHIITGTVIEAESGKPIPFANVFIKDKGKGTISGGDGTFILNHMCGESYNLTVSFLGYETVEQVLKLNSDTELIIQLYKSTKKLNDVFVRAKVLSASQRESQQLNAQVISEDANLNLANMLESLPGVSTLKNGSGIAKPVVQGMYGNRLPILNNGIAQSGQQWGNDHSPEIDPLVANTISVLSGVEALHYQGRSLGSMILVEPENIRHKDRLSGKAAYYFESNGLVNGANIQLQKYAPGVAWKVSGTLKKGGDQRSATYYLTNTGIREANLAIQLEKKWSDSWHTDVYLSSFNTEIGILRGSHIGNLTDLEEALQRKEPFYTNEHFSYAINAPKQVVSHHFYKFRTKYFIDSESWLNFIYAGQFNERKEFDVRKGGRSDIPAMSLLQTTHFFEAKYTSYILKDWRLNTGVQFNFIDNTNNPETGILPLIPDYYAYETGVFATSTKRINRWQIDVGGRYDYQHQKVAAISYTIPREVVRYANNYHNLKLGVDTRYHLSSTSNLSAGVNYASRNPEVNELYSNGLHQGVGGIEEGDPDLQQEQGIKGTLTYNAALTRKFQFEMAFYYQYINDYIFLNPQDEIRLTIRGAFPVFKYEQTNAHIYGTDFTAHYHFTKNLKYTAQYSYLRGHNVTEDMPLVNMPANSFKSSLRYHINKLGAFNDFSIDLNQQYVFEQSHLLPEQDYVLPPEAYNLVGLRVSVQKRLKHSHLNIYTKVDNLFNVAYRDYMNRLRYFADDPGVNVTVGCSWAF